MGGIKTTNTLTNKSMIITIKKLIGYLTERPTIQARALIWLRV